MTERIKQELVEFVNRELRDCEEYARTKEDVLGYRNRAYGAMMFAFYHDSSLYREMCGWWNEEILVKFNTLHDRL